MFTGCSHDEVCGDVPSRVDSVLLLWNPGVCPANRRDPLLSGLLASGPFLKDKLLALVESDIRTAKQAR
jgi:hypothetical protein